MKMKPLMAAQLMLAAGAMAGTSGCAYAVAATRTKSAMGSPQAQIEIAAQFEKAQHGKWSPVLGWSFLPPFLPGSYPDYGAGPCGYGSAAACSAYNRIDDRSAIAADAIHRYRVAEAASNGDAAAMYELAGFFANGLGTKRDQKKALKYYKKSADAGNANALEKLAVMNDGGVGGGEKKTGTAFVPRQKPATSESVDSLIELGKTGDIQANIKLGDFCAEGTHGLGKNDSLALIYWQKAVMAGAADLSPRIAAAEARISAQAEVARLAKKRAEEDRQRIAAAEARISAQAEAARMAEKHAKEERQRIAARGDGAPLTDFQKALAEAVELLDVEAQWQMPSEDDLKTIAKVGGSNLTVGELSVAAHKTRDGVVTAEFMQKLVSEGQTVAAAVTFYGTADEANNARRAWELDMTKKVGEPVMAAKGKYVTRYAGNNNLVVVYKQTSGISVMLVCPVGPQGNMKEVVAYQDALMDRAIKWRKEHLRQAEASAANLEAPEAKASQPTDAKEGHPKYEWDPVNKKWNLWGTTQAAQYAPVVHDAKSEHPKYVWDSTNNRWNLWGSARPAEYASIAAADLKKQAELGNAEAQNAFAECLMVGRGITKNETEAMAWCQKSATQGNSAAQFNLAGGFLAGQGGLPQDDVEAAKWYRKSADQGYAPAQNLLGACYQQGRGVSKDEVEAVAWYRKAAEQGNALAQGNLGGCYFSGAGVSKDNAEAEKWIKKAAEQGDANAQFTLGGCYSLGLLGSKDEAEAVKWFRKAAAQGNENAKAALKKLGY